MATIPEACVNCPIEINRDQTCPSDCIHRDTKTAYDQQPGEGTTSDRSEWLGQYTTEYPNRGNWDTLSDEMKWELYREARLTATAETHRRRHYQQQVIELEYKLGFAFGRLNYEKQDERH